MQKLKLSAVFALAVLAIIWILQNTGSVQTKFLFVTVTMPQAALLAITLLAGCGGGLLIALSLGAKLNSKGT
jgi:uncharacterized integral membrane protein